MKRAARPSSISGATQPDGNFVDITDVDEVWKRLEPWQQELIARRWVKRTGRQPAGRADGQRGSQQSFFEMDLPGEMCLQYLGLGHEARANGFATYYKARYTVSAATGEIEWKKSNTIDTYFMDDKDAVANYLKFETRDAAAKLAVFGCSKGVVKRESGVKVVCSVVPPLIIE
eukprot:6197997-Pleurochrysis_carterae.AAC.1